MKYTVTIILGIVTLFFGVYAMVLELNSISPLDQLSWCMLFGLMTYWSRSFPLTVKIANYFKTKNNEISEKVIDYFKIEKTGNETLLLGDFANKDFCHWLQFIHDGIQKALNEKLIDGKKIENYVNLTFYLARQRVDISIIKDGCKSPHELLQDRIIKPQDHIHCPQCKYPIYGNDILPLLQLLKQEAEKCNAFFKAVSRMRELQNELIDLGTALTHDEFCEIICKQNEATKAAEKQVDDFLAKRRVE